MSTQDRFKGIVRARSAAAETLLSTLHSLPGTYSEAQLAAQWLSAIGARKEVYPCGWYQPPPCGMSILIGSPPNYERLQYQSLREPANFPGESVFEDESILYPYYSSVDKASFMIGDHVATYYEGKNRAIQEWMREVYHLTRGLVGMTKVGMTFSELYSTAGEMLRGVGAKNNTFSTSGGLASDIGHTVPFFDGIIPQHLFERGALDKSVANTLAGARSFVSAANVEVIKPPCAFTVEPQIIIDGYPMVSFHMIVVVLDDGVYVVEKFFDLFEFFGMTDWLSLPRRMELS